MKNVLFYVLVTVGLFLFLVTLPLSPLASQPLPDPLLYLNRGSFDIAAAQVAAPTADWAVAAPGSYAIIQFGGPITHRNRSHLLRTGVTVLEYLPAYAYLVQGTAEQLNAAGQLPDVYGRTSFTLADKLAPSLLNALAQGNTRLGTVQIFAWPGENGRLSLDLAAMGMTPVATVTAQQLHQIAQVESVRWIEPMGRPRLLNDSARTVTQVNAVWQNAQLFGNGQIVAYADSGLDTGSLATLSPDFAGRIVATHILVPGQDWGDNHGHGTHVAGSITGAGVQSGANPSQHNYTASFAGVAPEAGLVVQAFEADPGTGAVTGLPADYYELFDQAYPDGARIHSNSWGDVTGPVTDTEAMYGGYPYGAQRTDQFMWDHPDMAIFAAAGNSGADGVPGPFGFCSGGNGVIDPDSLLSPATAKNVITVGASEAHRLTGGVAGYPWILLSLCFATNPIASDPVSNNPNGMAAFSSRGPTDDGRSKPDIVAPGTNNISNRSLYPGASTLWGVHETNTNYAYSGGTSMATPLTAGMGVLVREWLGLQGFPNPSAAALKAVLLNTTYNMAPGQYGMGGTQEIPYTRPNSVAGWGRADLGFMVAPPPYLLWLDDHIAGLNTNDSVNYTGTAVQPLTVLTTTQPLRVMLVWTDPPASLSAATQLVNDLDLQVIAPDSTVYYGNSIPTGDRLNNVEGVIIDTPMLGTYQVQVTAFNVPIASQPYALAVAGPLATSGDPTPTATATNTPAPTATHTPTNTSTATNTATAVPTNTATATHTPTPIPTDTPTPTFTPTPVPTDTPTATSTPPPVPTDTPTAMPEPTETDTPAATHTPTAVPTETATATFTPPPTPTGSVTPTATPEIATATPTPTNTATAVPSATPTNTATATAPPPVTFLVYLPFVRR